MVPSTRSTQKKSKLVSNGGVKKGKNRTIDEINIIIEKVKFSYVVCLYSI
jgi:hypothetical protein